MTKDFDKICEKYGDRLYAAAFNICRQQQDAEDAVQDALLAYYRTDKEFETEEHIKAWLLRVTVNAAKSTKRLFWNRNRTSYEEYMDSLIFEEPSDRMLMDEVLALPEKYRIVIHLFYFEEYKTREIAEILKLSENTVKTRLSNGRKILKTRLEGWEDE
jgi:RNA polymerase sigma-70 factor (ECF subfamily)